ncbi:MAG: hypothetical protein Q4D42_03085 [Eubacteriales bacterium]|nr:hypothetical protein [Eubacteriales bacterium]
MLDERSLLPGVYRSDPWLKELFQSSDIVHQSLLDEIFQLYKDLFFDTLSKGQVAVEERICGLDNSVFDLDTRRALIEARWKTTGTCGVELLQTICDSWENGRCSVSFVDGAIVLNFTAERGVPNNLSALATAIEAAKPAHLPAQFKFEYNTHDVIGKYTHAQLAAMTHEQIHSKEGL